MKKNLLLYVLLVFLIVANGFFLFNHLGNSDEIESRNRPKGPAHFIVKELNFDDDQMFEFKRISRHQHQKMRRIGEEVKQLKNAMFNKISDVSLDENSIDSIATLIGLKVKEKDIEAFYHFKDIQELCNDKQKEKFKRIVNDALHKGGREEQRPPVRNGDGKHRPPPKH